MVGLAGGSNWTDRDGTPPAADPENLKREMRARMVAPSFPHHDPVRLPTVPEAVDLDGEEAG